jgi:hypothetical protein
LLRQILNVGSIQQIFHLCEATSFSVSEPFSQVSLTRESVR